MGYALVWLVNTVVTLYIWVIIIMAVMSWLIAFNVINARNTFVYQILRFFEAVTEPVLRPLRRVIPSLGGVDLTPIVLILGLQFLLIIFNRAVAPYLLLLG
jgi:YggT family protein